MNLLIDIIGYIGAALLGAVCLEIFWYERRRRKHAREDFNRGPVITLCPFCGVRIARTVPQNCPHCTARLWPTEDNPPQKGREK